MDDKQDLKKVQTEAAKEMIQKTFGENLFALMTAKKITQKELAAAVGVTAATLSSYKNGSKSPTLPVAAAIAKELNVSLDWLCGLNEMRSENSENTTFSDIIRMLTDLSRLIKLDLMTNYEVNHDATAGLNAIYMRIDDGVMDSFLKEWKQVKELFDAHTIGSNIYDPWIAQQLKDYDCTLDDIPDKFDTPVMPDQHQTFSWNSDDEEVPF